MDNRELLELAAKAAGHILADPIDSCIPSGGVWIIDARGHDAVWNPLHDDGDAFRLAVKLAIDITFPDPSLVMACCGNEEKGHWHKAFVNDIDDYEPATRQAITYAASEIGRSMVDQPLSGK